MLLEEHSNLHLPDGRKTVVRNYYLLGRTVQTGIGDIVVKVCDRSGNCMKFNSRILPIYLKRFRSVEGSSTKALFESVNAYLAHKGFIACGDQAI